MEILVEMLEVSATETDNFIYYSSKNKRLEIHFFGFGNVSLVFVVSVRW